MKQITWLRSRFHSCGRLAVLLGASAFFCMASPAANAQVVLSNNLTAKTSGTEAALGSAWLTASFGTDTSTYSLTGVTLLLANPIPGQARLDLYSDGNLEPGSSLGTLLSPASYSTSLASTGFTSTGIT